MPDSRKKVSLPLLVMVLFVGLFSLIAPRFAFAEHETAIEITGDGVATPITLTMEQLEAMQQYQQVYSTLNTWPSKRWYVGKGVKLRDLFALAGIKDEATLIRFISRDGYDITLTVKELLKDKRYYYPHFKENHPHDGTIPGSTDGALEVEPILALLSAEDSDNPADMNDRDSLLLIFGQRAITEQTNNLFLKYVSKIEVLTSEPVKWDAPSANIESGATVPVGTKLRLHNKGNNEDKIYYTTDGSTPTVNSPMFNWSASRWWPLRGDGLDNVNSPIEIKEDTVIKAVTIGPGKEDSEVVTFIYKADPTGQAVDPTKVPGGPATGVTLDQSRINLNVGSTYQLTATVTPFNATVKDVTWSSSDTSVATVDNHGLVTVVGQGTAVITVKTKDGNHTATCIVNGPEEVSVVIGSEETISPEVEQSQTPEEAEPDNNLTVSGDVPEDRRQYLAERSELAEISAINPDLLLEDIDSQNIKVFELSVESTSIPLNDYEKKPSITVLLLIIFLSGVGKRYLEYVKEL
ncbi:Ig-like domain-containing protein [Desulfofalx alkaliphila]|uniref:Ig-like domain-containing protein n=1 Tax=Desulfofalx alkaliphila TaxID=105483 RepID=UPI00054E23C1|nr:Ig-like domain-containing protein [Desulfofalx alkaliphila]